MPGGQQSFPGDIIVSGNGFFGGLLTLANSLSVAGIAGTSLNLNGLFPVTRLVKFSAVLTPLIVAANTTAEQIFAVAGVAVGDVVSVNKPTSQPGLGIVGVRVSSPGNVAINFSNNTIAGITPTAAETYLFSVVA